MLKLIIPRIKSLQLAAAIKIDVKTYYSYNAIAEVKIHLSINDNTFFIKFGLVIMYLQNL